MVSGHKAHTNKNFICHKARVDINLDNSCMCGSQDVRVSQLNANLVQNLFTIMKII